MPSSTQNTSLAQYIQSGDCRLALNHMPGNSDVGVLFCGGFKSNRKGQKAITLETLCCQQKIPNVRFDYSGHGDSEGLFVDGNIDTWLKDTLCVIDNFTTPQRFILVGSSMGAWIAVLAARERAQRVAAVVTIAAAPDFTERLMPSRFSESQRAELSRNKSILLPSEYDDGSPYPISRQLLQNSRKHCVLEQQQQVDVPVRMLHGTDDKDVPFELSIELMATLSSDDIHLTLIKDADHRLSTPTQLAVLEQTVKDLHQAVYTRKSPTGASR